MHKETLKTAYSSNPEENLLFFADENDLSDSSSNDKQVREEIKGWINQIPLNESSLKKKSTTTSERKRSVPTRRRLFYSRASSRNQENKDSLKLRLNEYLDHSDDEPSFEFEKTSIEMKTETPFLSYNCISIDPKESRFREQQSKNKTKLNSTSTSRNQSHSLSMKLRTSSPFRQPEKTTMNTSFRLKTHKKVQGTIFPQPVVASFPSDRQDYRLKEKLDSYLRTHIKIHNI